MKPIYEYILKKDINIKKLGKFPEDRVESDIIKFLEDNGYEKINIMEFTDTSNVDVRDQKRLQNIEKNSKNREVYYLKINTGSRFNEIWFFKGGKISEDNPVFSIIAFPTKEKIHKGFYSSHIYFSAELSSKNELKQTRTFSSEEYDEFKKLLKKYNIARL